MNFYQEITLIEQAEISSYFIWSKLYTQLHLALVKIKDQNDKVNIGISFPQYSYEKIEEKEPKVSLGVKLRIFAEAEDTLQCVNICKLLERLNDYLHVSSIRAVPQDRVTAYVNFQRKQFKTNAERLARHRVKTRNDIGFDEAVKLYKSRVTSTDLPFIQMKSLTNGYAFKLFIEKSIVKKTDKYIFSTYGLSSKSSVPEFD